MVMQPCRDETMKFPGLDHPEKKKRRSGQNQNDGKRRREELGRPGLEHPVQNKQQEPPAPGLDHPGRNKQQEPPPPGLDHPETRGCLAPRTRSSGAGHLSAQLLGSTGRAEAGPVIRV